LQLIKNKHYKIIDNFFEINYFNELRDTVIQSEWRFVPNINSNHTEEDNNCYFQNVIYEHEPLCQEYHLFDRIWGDFDIRSLIRIKANCYPAKDELVTHSPHTDAPFDHNGAIICLNTCDGYTQLSDGTKIESIENRVLFFNAGLEHSSTNCTDAKARFNINVNYF
jgi:hypothetical protein